MWSPVLLVSHAGLYVLYDYRPRSHHCKSVVRPDLGRFYDTYYNSKSLIPATETED